VNRYYINRKYKAKRLRKIYDDMTAFERHEWPRRMEKFYKSWVVPKNLNKAPSWYNNLFSVRPARRIQKRLLKSENLEKVDWPDYKKPTIYYW